MKNFCLSYSSGKDCLLAMDRLVQAGNQPVALVTTLSDEINRSWFHGIPISVLEAKSSRSVRFYHLLYHITMKQITQKKWLRHCRKPKIRVQKRFVLAI